jgi:hypothetical protein
MPLNYNLKAFFLNYNFHKKSQNTKNYYFNSHNTNSNLILIPTITKNLELKFFNKQPSDFSFLLVKEALEIINETKSTTENLNAFRKKKFARSSFDP